MSKMTLYEALDELREALRGARELEKEGQVVQCGHLGITRDSVEVIVEAMEAAIEKGAKRTTVVQGLGITLSS